MQVVETIGAPSCIAQVRHFDQPSTNLLNKEILFEKSSYSSETPPVERQAFAPAF
jgi:hypothetical protein